MADRSLQGVTAAEKFLSCNSKQNKLFSVNPGVPAVNALETASCFLGDALNALSVEETPCFAAQRCIEFALAAINAVIAGGIGDNTLIDRRQRDVIEYVAHLLREGALIANPAADEVLAKDARHFLDWTAREVKGGAA